jgi:uncharacterized coiled-coil protein SlyX
MVRSLTTPTATIRDVTTGNADAIPVLIDSAGQLGTVSSSRRFKKEIEPMDRVSESILALKPVTFEYKSDSTGTPQFGLIAEEVAEVNADLVVRDDKGEIYTVRYEAVNAMLLNEFLKEHKGVEAQQATINQLESKAAKQEATIADLKQSMGILTAQLKEQAAQIQRVIAEVEMNRPAPRVSNRYHTRRIITGWDNPFYPRNTLKGRNVQKQTPAVFVFCSFRVISFV